LILFAAKNKKTRPCSFLKQGEEYCLFGLMGYKVSPIPISLIRCSLYIEASPKFRYRLS